MKNIYLLLFSLIAFAFTACQQEELDGSLETPSVDSDAVPVNILFSMEPGIENSTEYEPMRSAAGTLDNDSLRVKISNAQRVIIAKKIDTRWVFETTVDFEIEPGNWSAAATYEIERSTILGPFRTQLTPGEYKATVISGVRSTAWFDHNLQKGDLLGYTDGTPFDAPKACSYMAIPGGGYIYQGLPGLPEEIFAGSAEFEVKKTQSLDSIAYANSVDITLHRKVSKLRILLQINPDIPPGGAGGINEFYYTQGEGNSIAAMLETTEATPFCNGLNVWGEPYYDPDNKLTELPYAVFTSSKWRKGSDGLSYLIGMRHKRQFDCFYFSDPKQDVPITITELEIIANTNFPKYIYPDGIEGFVLRHNQMTGMIFKAGPSGNQSDTFRYAEPVMDDNGVDLKMSTDKFSFPYEYFGTP